MAYHVATTHKKEFLASDSKITFYMFPEGIILGRRSLSTYSALDRAHSFYILSTEFIKIDSPYSKSACVNLQFQVQNNLINSTSTPCHIFQRKNCITPWKKTSQLKVLCVCMDSFCLIASAQGFNLSHWISVTSFPTQTSSSRRFVYVSFTSPGQHCFITIYVSIRFIYDLCFHPFHLHVYFLPIAGLIK